MTYCVGLRLDRGLVFMSDTRTNSGVDNIASYGKMHTWSRPGERAIVLLSAGNLATSQAVTSLLDERSKAPADRNPSILEAPTMFQVARLVGQTLREVIGSHAGAGQRAESTFNSTLIVGGQIGEMEPRLFLVYPEGNFIEASAETPFLQIGETKYGKAWLDLAVRSEADLATAAKVALSSMSATALANLSVGPPYDLALLARGSTRLRHLRIDGDSPYLDRLSEVWTEHLMAAIDALPDVEPGDIEVMSPDWSVPS